MALPEGVKTSKKKGKKHRKYGRNQKKCEQYRLRVGKPNGRGVPGNKAGRNHTKLPATKGGP